MVDGSLGKGKKDEEKKPRVDESIIPPGFKLLTTLRDQASRPINRIRWSPDGKWLAAPSANGSIYIWQVDDGKLYQILQGHSDKVYTVDWSVDAKKLVSASYDKSICLWDIETGGSDWKINTQNAMYGVSWRPDGQMIAACSTGREIILYNAKNGEHIRKLQGHSVAIWTIDWSSDGKLLASGSGDKTIRLWGKNTIKSQYTLQEHTGEINGLSWFQNSKRLITASDDKTLRVWDAENGRQVRILEGHEDAVYSVSLSANEAFMASKSLDGSVRLWSCASWETVAILNEVISSYLCGLMFHPTQPNILATLGEAGTIIRVWELDYDVILANAPKKQSVFYTTAKIALVGDSGVGKSGLGWRIAEGQFRETSSTHGQSFWVIPTFGKVRTDGTIWY